MKLIIAAALAATAIGGASAPAMAQPYGAPPPAPNDWHDHGGGPTGPSYGGPGYGDHDRDHPDFHGPDRPGGWDLDHRIDWTQQRITRGRANGWLDWRAARRAQHSLDRIRQAEQRYRYEKGGRLDDGETQRLMSWLDQVNGQIRMSHQEDQRPW